MALEGTRGEKQRNLDNIKQGIKAALQAGQAPDPTFIEIRKEAGVELIDAENAVAIAENRLNTLQSKTVGKAAAREARARVRAFMATGRDDLAEREKFNEWFHTTGLVVLVSPATKTAEIGLGVIEDNRLRHFEAASEMILGAMQGKDNEEMRADYLEDLAERQKTGKTPGDDVTPEEFYAALKKHLPAELFPPED